MTREEAITELELMKSDVEHAEAIDFAIKELSKTGTWIFSAFSGEWTCSHCKLFTSDDFSVLVYRHCPICSAKMRIAEEQNSH